MTAATTKPSPRRGSTTISRYAVAGAAGKCGLNLTLRAYRALWGQYLILPGRWGGDALLIRADVAYAPLAASLGAAPAVYVTVDMVM